MISLSVTRGFESCREVTPTLRSATRPDWRCPKQNDIFIGTWLVQSESAEVIVTSCSITIPESYDNTTCPIEYSSQTTLSTIEFVSATQCNNVQQRIISQLSEIIAAIHYTESDSRG